MVFVLCLGANANASEIPVEGKSEAVRMVTLKSIHSGGYLSAESTAGAEYGSLRATVLHGDADNAKWILEFVDHTDPLYVFAEPSFRLKNVATQQYLVVPSAEGGPLRADGDGTTASQLFALEYNYEARLQLRCIQNNRTIHVDTGDENKAKSSSTIENGVESAFQMTTISRCAGINVISRGNRYSADEEDYPVLNESLEYFIEKGLTHVSFRVIWNAIQDGIDYSTDENLYDDGTGRVVPNTKRMLATAKQYGLHTMLDFHSLWGKDNYTYPSFLTQAHEYIGPAGTTNTLSTDHSFITLKDNPVFYYSMTEGRNIRVREIYCNMLADLIAEFRDDVDVISVFNEPYNQVAMDQEDKEEFLRIFKVAVDTAKGARHGDHQKVGIRFSGGWNPWSTDSSKRFDKQLVNDDVVEFDLLGDLDFIAQNYYYDPSDLNDVKWNCSWPLDMLSDPDLATSDVEMWLTESNYHPDDDLIDVVQQDVYLHTLFQRIEDFGLFDNVLLWNWQSTAHEPGENRMNLRYDSYNDTDVQQVGNMAFGNLINYIEGQIPDNEIEMELPSSSHGADTVDGPDDTSKWGLLDFDDVAGSYAEYNVVHVPHSGHYTLIFRYVNGSSHQDYSIRVNGVDAGTVPFASTGDWLSFANAAKTVTLNEGFNTLRIEVPGSVGIQLDTLKWEQNTNVVVLVGESILNGNFNATTGSGSSFDTLDHWVNIGMGPQTLSASQTNKTFDGTRNASIAQKDALGDSIHGLDTGYMLSEGDIFDVGYHWLDAWQWDDANDRIRVSLFTTDNNAINGSRTDLVVDLSEGSALNNTYEQVSHPAVYTATAQDAGKKLFVAIDGTAAVGAYARMDDFKLVVTKAPTVMKFERWAHEYALTGDEQGDDDNDGVVNLVEYAFGGNPTNENDVGILPTFGTKDGLFTLLHVMRIDSGIDYNVEMTSNLVSGIWMTNGMIKVSGPVESGFATVTNSVSVTNRPQAYIRLTISGESE
ncbi:carbohydrate-binding protein [Pontiellaceae bacterium B12227]|nr:carbohydrate-binding protein [Pontiellaceae bacterium B12227]